MNRVTKEIVIKAKGYLLNHPDLTQEDIGILCGVSKATVCYIGKGDYDDLLNEDETEKTITTDIPYEEFEKLQASKYAVMELFLCTKNSNDDDTLFIDYHTFSTIMRKYFPEDFAKRKNKVKHIRF